MEGLICGRYRITEKLGEGGMAEIWTAEHDLIDQRVAVKLLQPQMSAQAEIVKRFLKEARAASAINHPGIVQIFDVGYAEDGRAYIVMELLQGESLGDRLQRVGRLSIAEARLVTRQLAGAMEAAHARHIYHRDLKPENLFIVPDPEVEHGERIKVLDFGLAKLNSEYAGTAATAKGSIFGTPAYMAPEQCMDSGEVDGRADLYSIGCILFRCLCGRPPFERAEPLALLEAQIRETPPRARALRPDIPDHLDALIMRLLEKQPESRPQTCGELLAALSGDDASAPGSHAATTLVDLEQHMPRGSPPPPADDHDAITLVKLGPRSTGPAAPNEAAPHDATMTPPGGPQHADRAPAATPWPPPMGVPPTDHAAPRDTRAHAGPWSGKPDRSWLVLVALVVVGIAVGGIWAILAGSDEPPPVQTDAAADRSSDAAGPSITPADVAGVADAASMADAAGSVDAAGVADAGAGEVSGRDGSAQDTPSPSAAATSPGPLTDADVKRLMAEGTEAYKRRLYRRASRACTRVISHRPRHAGANRLCTMAACNQRSAVRARRYYRRVPDDQRALLRNLCQRFDVALEPPASQP